jgi:hypothetical protein
MDRALLAHFLRARCDGVAGPGGQLASPVIMRIVERLRNSPVMVFSSSGEVLEQTWPAIALFGDYIHGGGSSRHVVDRWFTDPQARERYLVEIGPAGRAHLRRYRHAGLGVLELYRQVLVDPAERQLLLAVMAVPGSASEEKLRLLTGPGN